MSSNLFDYNHLMDLEAQAYNTAADLEHTTSWVTALDSRIDTIETALSTHGIMTPYSGVNIASMDEISALKAEIAELRLIIQSIKPYIPVIEGIEDII